MKRVTVIMVFLGQSWSGGYVQGRGFGNLSKLTSGCYPIGMVENRLKIVKVKLVSPEIRVACKGST